MILVKDLIYLWNMEVYNRNKKAYPFKSKSEILNVHRHLFSVYPGSPVIRDSTKSIYKRLK